MRPVAAISSAPSEYSDLVTRLETRVFLPADPVQHGGIVAFEFPVHHVALIVGDIEKEVAVRVGPFNLGNDARQRDGSVHVILRAKGVMRQQWNRQETQNNNQRAGLGYSSRHGSPRPLIIVG